MAKGSSRLAATVLECQEDAGECRRSVAGPVQGRVAGTEHPSQAASMVDRRFSSSVRRPLQPRCRSRVSCCCVGSGSGQPRGTIRRRRWGGTTLHRVRGRTVPRRATRRSQGSTVPSAAGARGDDPQGQRETAGLGHPDRTGPGCAGRPQAGARTNLRSGLQAVLLRLPPEAPSPGRHRRDPLPRVGTPQLRVGVGGRHQGVLRRDRPHRSHGTGATSRRRQTRTGPGKGVLEGWRSHRERHRTRQRHRHTPRRDPHRCSPTSLCPLSTSTSPRRGRRWATPAPVIGDGAKVWRPTDSFATRTTLS